MNRLTPTALYRIFGLCTWLIGCGEALAAVRAPVPPVPTAPDALVTYDRGGKKGTRVFRTIESCVETPCIVTQHGAWRFAPEAVRAYRIAMGYVHDGGYRPIGLFQQSTTFEQKLGERLINRYPNRKIVNLLRRIESGAIGTVYMYGLLLQNEFHEGDPLIITLTDEKDRARTFEYYFRFHRTGVMPDLDLTLLYPLNVFHPNSGNAIQGATGGAAFSFSLASNMDPEHSYNLFRKIFRAVRLNLFAGLMSRKELTTIGADLVVKDSADGFGGIGITLFDFLNAGYGVNFFRAPHSTFPFVGIEVRHAFKFIRSLKHDTHTRWEKYLKHEAER